MGLYKKILADINYCKDTGTNYKEKIRCQN